MGMDIYGLSPVLRSKQPHIEWHNATDEERRTYIASRDRFEEENPGFYYRANIWAWRPIAEIIIAANDLYRLELDPEFIQEIHYNSGAGLKTQAECDKLANFMETYIENHFDGWKTVGLNVSWFSKKVVDHKGQISTVTIKGDEEIKVCTYANHLVFIEDGELELDGFVYYTSHTCSIEWIYEFIKFLRECGGFEIR